MVKNSLLSIFASLCVASTTLAEVQSTNLPAELNSTSMKIEFDLDTTWHTVHGVAKDLAGRVWLEVPSDPGSIRASLTIPVSALDTGSENRDDEMRDSMEARRFSSIHVEMPRISPSCDVRSLAVGSACTYATKGAITIRDVTLPIALEGDVHRDSGGALLVNGSTHLDWSAFGVKDPSILIATVNEEVKIKFVITLPKQSKEKSIQ